MFELDLIYFRYYLPKMDGQYQNILEHVVALSLKSMLDYHFLIIMTNLGFKEQKLFQVF